MTSTEYLLPRLPFGSAEYTIVRWLKRVGEPVSVGEPLLVVVNDRLEAALPATCAGILDHILLAEGAAVVMGTSAATIVTNPAASVSAAPHDQPVSEPAVRISPVARRIIHAENVDITELHGTGVSGRIMKADILAALAAPLPDAPSLGDHKGRAYDGASPRHPVTTSPATRHSSPVTRPRTPSSQLPSLDAYALTAIDVDLERVATLIIQHGPSFAGRRIELSYIVCVALAAVAALPYHPLLNSYWADAVIVARRRVHLAVVPCAGAPIRFVCDAQDLNLRGLARGLGGPSFHRDTAAAAQDIGDRTFTIVDLGDHVWGDPAAWSGGGAAALGIGAVRARPLVMDDHGVDRLAVRHMALLTLAYDARVLGQCHADAFLREVKCRLEQFHV